ncbi:MAG: SDR family NAD(P)-dependent oxidoreductase [Bacteroidetes bacterium]|jgi:NADP-dependent 3-hydroxy acid dehydrogenase YdfG|nr:SDR family NAD(P)-dependent oxidoreductase [Bacteroidota bacterium]MCA6442281.1 SDR family NAD(P)-dependent oxidoreductase [Bacteroidota bacterium]
MTVLITGATSGIGLACAKIFAKHGYNLVLTGRRKDRLQQIKTEIEKEYHVNVLTLNFDIRDHQQCEEAIQSLSRDNVKLDILINNAGLAAGLSTLQEGKLEHWETMIDTNIKGLLYISRIVSRLMIENRIKGHIINIGSIAGKEVYPNGNVYCASKHAVDALNKAMRIDLLPHQIKVSAVNPGMVETEFSLVRFDGDAERAKKVYEGLKPLAAEDIAETVFWVVNRPSHVNINDIVIMPTAQATSTINIRN